MDEPTSEAWRALLDRRSAAAHVPLYGPLLAAPAFVMGRLAQSLDGYIATTSCESRWISGPGDIRHTHRLRALADAVVVGASTVQADDPQLTTRLVAGGNPVRVVLDPRRRLAPRHRVFDGRADTLLIAHPDTASPRRVGAAEVLRVPAGANGFDLSALLACLADRGLRRVYIEGGGDTVARFLLAGLLDRLHVTIAPVLMGGGMKAFPIPPTTALPEARRFAWIPHRLGADVLLDIDLREGFGRA